MSEFIIAETEFGQVKGLIKTSTLNTVYNSFLGIRYAAPPIGELRFKVIDPFRDKVLVSYVLFSHRTPRRLPNGMAFTMQQRRSWAATK